MAVFVLLHGIPGSAASWGAVASLLAPGQEVLAPDLLGFGEEHVEAGPDALLAPNQARHVLACLDERSIGQVALVGHDFGGPVAAHVLAMAPQRVVALALFATNAFPDTPIPFPLSMLNVPVVGSAAQRALFSRPSLAMMVRRGTGRPKPHLDLRTYLGDATQQAAIATIFSSSLRRLQELYTPVREALASARVPALVGWGDRDPFFSVSIGRRTAELIPGARFRLYEGAGHFLPEERPREVAADLVELTSTTVP